MNDEKRLLITGATGFIGASLLAEAEKQGYAVSVAVRPQTSVKSVKRLQEKGIPVLRLDYQDEAQIFETLQKEGTQGRYFDYVIHNAGATKALKAEELYQANAKTTEYLARAFERLERQPKRFVLMSSLSAYGEDPSGRISASTPRTPKSHYGKSKFQAEQALQATSLNYTILQPTGVYGIEDKDYLIQINSVLQGFNVMSGLSQQSLSYVYVKDLVRAVFFLLEKEEANKQSFIISDSQDYGDNVFGQIIRSYLSHHEGALPKGKKYYKFCLNLRFPLAILWLVCNVSDFISGITKQAQTLNKDKYHIITQRSWLCDAQPLFDLGFKPEYDLEKGLTEILDSLFDMNEKKS